MPGMRLAAVLTAAVFLPTRIHSASVDVNPVRIDLQGQGQPAELRLTNRGNVELAVQVDVMKWDQGIDGQDQLTQTDELLAVPPIFTVPPGDQQIVRIGFLGQPSAEFEQTYRLFVTELAPPQVEDNTGSELAFRMRFSIPAFVAPVTFAARPELELVGVAADEDSTVLTVENRGTGHARVARIEIFDRQGWQPLPESITIRYLLPGAVTTIAIPPEFESPSAVRISSIDGRDWEYAVGSLR